MWRRLAIRLGMGLGLGLALLGGIIAALNSAEQYRVANPSTTQITEWSQCRNVTNNFSTGQDIFVPTKTADEWARFYNNPPTGVAATSCSGGTTLAYCWGMNDFGQLGVGDTVTKTVPTLVNGGFTDWSQLAIGGAASCGIRNGRLYCWGEMPDIGLSAVSPTEISSSLTGWTNISVGAIHLCGVRNNRAYCWGDNQYEQLGDGSTTNSAIPIQVSGGFSDWTDVTAGGASTCGRRSNGLAYCWGTDVYTTGILGNGNLSVTNQATPTLVSGGWSDWTSPIAIGFMHACGIRNGAIYCWGGDTLFGGFPVRGSGSFPESPTPTPSLVSGGFSWNQVSAGLLQSCGVRSNGQAYCWGGEVLGGELGDEGVSGGLAASPTLVAGGWSDWSKVQSSFGFTCGLRNSDAYCWGYGGFATLGNGTSDESSAISPTLVAGNGTWQDLVGSSSLSPETGERGHMCGLQGTSCALPWGGSIEDGQSVTAYQGSTVCATTPCVSETRTCNSGVLSGSYSQQACTANLCPCDLPWGGTTPDGTTVTAFVSSTPSGTGCGGNCVSEGRTCSDGDLSGTYTVQSCTNDPGVTIGAHCYYLGVASQSCDTTCGAFSKGCTLSGTRNYSGSAGSNANCTSVMNTLGLAGSASAVPFGTGSGCLAAGGSNFRDTSPATTCGASFAGAQRACSCASSCELPWGGTIANGVSVTAYSGSTSCTTNPCLSETRTCNFGNLSGSYTQQACTQDLCRCDLPWGGTIASGVSVTAYVSNTAGSVCGATCTGETRNCFDGNLSGTYQNQACTNEPGVTVSTHCYYLSGFSQSCNARCSEVGKTCTLAGTRNYSGSAGSNANCTTALTAMGLSGLTSSGSTGPAAGCFRSGINFRNTSAATTCGATVAGQRACSCN